jgi:hypothetical protein
MDHFAGLDVSVKETSVCCRPITPSFHPIATKSQMSLHFGFGPITTLCVAANKLITRSPRCLFDHFVGGREQRLRDGKADRLGGLEINH